MYSLSMSAARSLEAGPILDQKSLVQQMLEDGLALKTQHTSENISENHNLILSDEENADTDMNFIKSLTRDQKLLFLKYVL